MALPYDNESSEETYWRRMLTFLAGEKTESEYTRKARERLAAAYKARQEYMRREEMLRQYQQQYAPMPDTNLLGGEYRALAGARNTIADTLGGMWPTEAPFDRLHYRGAPMPRNPEEAAAYSIRKDSAYDAANYPLVRDGLPNFEPRPLNASDLPEESWRWK